MQIMYKTGKLVLTPFNRSIAENSNYENWLYDSEVTKYNHWGLFPQSRKKENEFLDMCESGEKDIVLSIMTKIDVKDDIYKHIGNVSLQSINWIYRSAEFAITIGEKKYWGKKFGYQAALLLFYHGFDKMNLNRIWTGTAQENVGMNKLAEKLEMKKEGIFRQGMFFDGEYHNIIQYAILQDQWRQEEWKEKVKQIMI